jgi:hypothetical protein
MYEHVHNQQGAWLEPSAGGAECGEPVVRARCNPSTASIRWQLIGIDDIRIPFPLPIVFRLSRINVAWIVNYTAAIRLCNHGKSCNAAPPQSPTYDKCRPWMEQTGTVLCTAPGVRLPAAKNSAALLDLAAKVGSGIKTLPMCSVRATERWCRLRESNPRPLITKQMRHRTSLLVGYNCKATYNGSLRLRRRMRPTLDFRCCPAIALALGSRRSLLDVAEATSDGNSWMACERCSLIATSNSRCRLTR